MGSAIHDQSFGTRSKIDGPNLCASSERACWAPLWTNAAAGSTASPSFGAEAGPFDCFSAVPRAGDLASVQIPAEFVFVWAKSGVRVVSEHRNAQRLPTSFGAGLTRMAESGAVQRSMSAAIDCAARIWKSGFSSSCTVALVNRVPGSRARSGVP